MSRLERRVETLEKVGGGIGRLVWITRKKGGIICNEAFYPDTASCRSALGLSDKDVLIGWMGDEDTLEAET